MHVPGLLATGCLPILLELRRGLVVLVEIIFLGIVALSFDEEFNSNCEGEVITGSDYFRFSRTIGI